MKIAVYGDSFALSRNNLDTSWYNVLSKKLNCTIDTYGAGGSSVYYSYKQFVKSHSAYDYVLFLVTEPSRYHSKVIFSTGDIIHVSGLNAIDWFKKNLDLSGSDMNLLKDLEAWYKVSDMTYASDMSELMLDNIETTMEKVVFVPCFPDSFSNKRILKEPGCIPLLDIVKRQVELLFGSPKLCFNLLANENPNVISGHFAPEFNEYIADVMYDRITTGKWDFSEYKNVKLQHKQDYYYRISE